MPSQTNEEALNYTNIGYLQYNTATLNFKNPIFFTQLPENWYVAPIRQRAGVTTSYRQNYRD